MATEAVASRRDRRRARGQTVTDLALALPVIVLLWCVTIDIGHVMLAKQRGAAALEAAIDYGTATMGADSSAIMRIACDNLVGTLKGTGVSGVDDERTCLNSKIVQFQDNVADDASQAGTAKKFSLSVSFTVPAILPINIPSAGGKVYTMPTSYPVQILKYGRKNDPIMNRTPPA